MIPRLEKRLGRTEGCIMKLVTILKGGDEMAAANAKAILNAMSSNTQPALNIAEAGYFKPLMKYLKEGSDMSKVLMATALLRMELTDQEKASLGEGGAIKALGKMFNTGNLESIIQSLLFKSAAKFIQLEAKHSIDRKIRNGGFTFTASFLRHFCTHDIARTSFSNSGKGSEIRR